MAVAGNGSEHQGQRRHGLILRPQGHGTIATGSIYGNPLPVSGLRQDYDKWCHLPKEAQTRGRGGTGARLTFILDPWTFAPTLPRCHALSSPRAQSWILLCGGRPMANWHGSAQASQSSAGPGVSVAASYDGQRSQGEPARGPSCPRRSSGTQHCRVTDLLGTRRQLPKNPVML